MHFCAKIRPIEVFSDLIFSLTKIIKNAVDEVGRCVMWRPLISGDGVDKGKVAMLFS